METYLTFEKLKQLLQCSNRISFAFAKIIAFIAKKNLILNNSFVKTPLLKYNSSKVFAFSKILLWRIHLLRELEVS